MNRGALGEQAFALPPAVTTLNPADTSTSLTLSAANLRATRNATTAARWVSSRGTTSKLTGLWYFEGSNINPGGAGQAVSLGLATSSYVIDDGVSQCLIGLDALALSLGYDNNGSIYQGGSAPNTAGTWQTAAAVAQIAANLTTRRFWARIPGGLWNGTIGADPATGIGGITITTALALFPAVSAFDPTTPDAIQCNFGQTAFVGPIPAGFAAWG